MVVLLFLDLYSQLTAIIVFILVSDTYQEDIWDFQRGKIYKGQIESGAHFCVLYVLLGYFVLHES